MSTTGTRTVFLTAYSEADTMVSIRDIFDKLGGITLTSTKKVGEGVQKPVKKIGEIKPKAPPIGKPGGILKRESKKPKPGFLSRRGSARVISRMKMTPEEIEVFKGLIEADKRLEERGEDSATRESFQRASLEEILKEEEKEQLDPKLIMILGGGSGAVLLIVMVVLGFGIEIGLAMMLAVLFMAIIIIFLPNLQKGKRSSEASRELPFALRQMATELKSGLGLHDSMRSVAMSGYGALSEEFARTLEEIKYGETTESALIEMSNRIESDGLKRAVYQITRTLNSGGDLSKTLNVIADDIAYEMRMKLKDYSQKLNSFTMIYMFLAILGPVIFLVMLLAASTVMGSVLPPIAIILIYLFLFPMLVGFMAFMIKRLEPKL